MQNLLLFSQRIVYYNYMCQPRLLKIMFICILGKKLNSLELIKLLFIFLSYKKVWGKQSRIEHLCGFLYKSLHHPYMEFLSLSHLIFPFDFWNSSHDNTDYLRKRRRASPSLWSSTEVPLAISPNICTYNSLSRTWQCGKNVLKLKFESIFLFFPPKEYCTHVLK